MTLNLNYYGDKHGAWETRRALIARTLHMHAPEVVALQAVASDRTRYDGLDQAAQLAQLLPQYRYVHFQEAMRAGNSIKGAAFLSRVPLLAVRYLMLDTLPGHNDQDRRVLLMARLDGPSGPIDLHNAHLSWIYKQAEENIRQAGLWIERGLHPALLVGDFNTTPERPVIGALQQQGWRDVWLGLNGTAPGPTFEADTPRLRIDYIFADTLLWPRARAIERIDGIDGASGARLSDHCALIASFD